MKKTKNDIEKVEHVIWTENGKKIHAAGFVVTETDTFITLSLTKSYGEYLDTKKILKKTIITRMPIQAT